MGRYYNEGEDEPDAWVQISKARHWDMAECEFQIDLCPESLNLMPQGQIPRKLNMDDWMYEQEDEEEE